MKFFREDVALELTKSLITSDQRELVRDADKINVKTADAMVDVAFKIADAFIQRRDK